MKEIKGNLWDYYDKGHVVCITTNGFVKKNGECVMGAGCAKEAKLKFPGLPLEAGRFISKWGNKVNYMPQDRLIMFPTKHNWWEYSDLELIKTSCKQLIEVLEELMYDDVVILPRPGCKNGGLDWETQVKPAIEPLLDDRVWVISNE